MTERDPEILSEEEAARVLGRAAQLQADAGKGLEAPAVDGPAVHITGYALADVRSAAMEAGIPGEFVEAALADLRAERTLPEAEKGSRLAQRFLDHPPDAITVRRVIEASPGDVLSAMQAVLPVEPFRLTLNDQQGDPLDRGVLIFDIPPFSNPFQRGFVFQAREGGLRQVFVSLRPIDGPSPSCELTVYSPVSSHNIGLGVGLTLTGLTGSAAFAAFGALGLAIGIAPVAAVAAVGAALGAGFGIKGYRAVYRWAMRTAGKALEGLVGAVAARAKGVW